MSSHLQRPRPSKSSTLLGLSWFTFAYENHGILGKALSLGCQHTRKLPEARSVTFTQRLKDSLPWYRRLEASRSGLPTSQDVRSWPHQNVSALNFLGQDLAERRPSKRSSIRILLPSSSLCTGNATGLRVVHLPGRRYRSDRDLRSAEPGPLPGARGRRARARGRRWPKPRAGRAAAKRR